MKPLVVVDAGPLVARVARGDPWNVRVADTLERADLDFVIGALPVAEAAFIVAARYRPRVEVQLVRAIRTFPIEAPTDADLVRMGELMVTYIDFPLGAADASVVALAERLGTDLVMTMDRRHFGAVRPRHCEAFRLLPE